MTRKELEYLHGSTVIWPIISSFEAMYSTTCEYFETGVRVVDRHKEAHVLSYQEIHEKIGQGEQYFQGIPDPPLGRNILFRQEYGLTMASMYATVPAYWTHGITLIRP